MAGEEQDLRLGRKFLGDKTKKMRTTVPICPLLRGARKGTLEGSNVAPARHKRAEPGAAQCLLGLVEHSLSEGIGTEV